MENNENDVKVSAEVQPKKSHTLRKIGCWVAAIAVVAIAVFVYVKFYFVFADGVKAGELNYFTNKGYVFKTYEGKLIQAGFKSPKSNGGTIVSNAFSFSVEDKAVEDKQMRCSGKTVELRYNEYLGTLPWRGVSKFVVTEIVSVR